MHRRTFRTIALLAAAASVQPYAHAQNTYTNTVLVADSPDYNPLIMVDPLLSNGWGLAIRPPGAGGHFWVSNFNTGTTTTYVGDVHGPSGFVPLFQDSLKAVDIAVSSGAFPDGRLLAPVPQPTGQVYNYSPTDFVVSGEGITGASKFIFVTAEGTISGWTEARNAQGVLHRQTTSVITVDDSANYNGEILRFTGCAVTDFPSNNRLYVTDSQFGIVRVYDHNWQPINLPPGRFANPVDPDGVIYKPWNIQYLRTGPNGEGRLWVAFVIFEDPWEEDPLYGKVIEFDLEGNFTRQLYSSYDLNVNLASELRAPWGIAIAPSNFGALSGAILVANFADGTIPAFDPQTGLFLDFLRDDAGAELVVDGIWGMTFGNGVALGDTNALYYAAGPDGEAGGTFGTIRFTPDTCPSILSQPADLNVAQSGSARFTVDAPSPVRLAAQWQIESAPGQWSNLADGPVAGLGTAAGAQSTRLQLEGLQPGNYRFRIRLDNACGNVTSQPALLVVIPSACALADITAVGGTSDEPGAPDGQLTVDDVIVFVNLFSDAAGCPGSAPCSRADVTDIGDTGSGPDGQLTVDDLIAFVNAFSNGC